MCSRYLCLLAVLAVLGIHSCSRSEAVERDPREAVTENLLTRYIQVNTSVPGGDYAPAVNLLVQALTEAGVEPQIIRCGDSALPSVYARIAGRRSGEDLLLLHHMDVVPADPLRWSVPPFSGEKKGGYIWGRGAIDDKSLGVAHLEAFLSVHRKGIAPERGLVFLAVPDEELGGRNGVGCLVAERSDLFKGVGAVLGEGGTVDTAVDRARVFWIEVHQKVPLWIRIRAVSRGGHGASADSASETLVQVLHQLKRELTLRSSLTPAAEQMFIAASAIHRGDRQRILRNPRQSFAAGVLDQAAGSWAHSLRDSMTITTLRAGSVVNSAPAEAYAELDLRLLPDTDVENVLNSIRRIADADATVEVLLEGSPTPPSPVSHPIYSVLERALPAAEKGAIVVPSLIPGTTDSRYFRVRGIPAYGFSPFKVNYYDAAGVHGDDERIRIRFFHEGVALMRDVVARYSSGE